MESSSAVRPHRAAVVLLLVLAAVPAAASDEPFEIALSPAVATWQDRVVVTVSGALVSPCGPYILSLRPTQPLVQAGQVIGLELVAAPCVGSPSTSHPFQLSFELPPLSPGNYAVEVDGSAIGGGTATVPLVVRGVSPLQILVPEAPRSDRPVTLRVRSHSTYCTSVFDLERPAPFVFEMKFGVIDCGTPAGPTIREHEVDLGFLAPGRYEVRLIDLDSGWQPALATASFRVWDAAGCVPSPTELCLLDGRFRLAVGWRDFQGGTGPGRPIPLQGRDDSGLFWFFHPENVELTVKVIDACALDGHFWVFVSSGSTVEYELTVTDTAAGEAASYRNELGVVPRLISDTAAFGTCAP